MSSHESEGQRADGDFALSHRLKSWAACPPTPGHSRDQILRLARQRDQDPKERLQRWLARRVRFRVGPIGTLGQDLVYCSDVWLFRLLPSHTSMHSGWVLYT